MTHQPNTPRKRTADGRRVDEPVQCEQCLQAWPCEVANLEQRLARALEVLATTRAQLLRRAEPMRAKRPPSWACRARRRRRPS